MVQNKTDSSITLQWSPPDSDRPVPIKGYIVDRKKVGAQTWQRCNATETIVLTEMTICNFTEEATYQFRISAINDFGQSPYLEVPGSFYLGKIWHLTTDQGAVVCNHREDTTCRYFSSCLCLSVSVRTQSRSEEGSDEQHCHLW